VAALRKMILLLALACAACAAEPRVPVGEIAPTGALRVAIGVGPSPSPFWATREATGPRGVTVDLARAAASNLGVPLKLVEYPNSGEIMKAAASGAWDVSFMPRDAEREKYVDQGPAYVVYESSYIVRPGSGIAKTDEIDRDGVRVGVVEGTSTSRTVAKSLRHAKLTLFPQAEEAQRAFVDGKVDALAMGREALGDFARKTPGSRVLEEVIQSTGVVVVVPKDHPAARAWAAQFLEQAKADGTVRRALDANGFGNATVAPRT